MVSPLTAGRAEGLAGKPVNLTIQNTQKWNSYIDYLDFAPAKEWRTFQFLVQSNGTADRNTQLQIWHGHLGHALAGRHHHDAGHPALRRRPLVAGPLRRSAGGLGRSVSLLPLVCRPGVPPGNSPWMRGGGSSVHREEGHGMLGERGLDPLPGQRDREIVEQVLLVVPQRVAVPIWMGEQHTLGDGQ